MLFRSPLDRRDAEGSSLAGAGLRPAHDVVGRDDQRDRRGLDRRHLREAQPFDRPKHARRQAERRKKTGCVAGLPGGWLRGAVL